MIRSRGYALFALRCALLFAFAGTAAAGNGVHCKSTLGDVPKTGADGSTCDADVIGLGKANAKASGAGSSAGSSVDGGGKATSSATKAGAAAADIEAGGVAVSKATMDADSDAAAFNNGKSRA